MVQIKVKGLMDGVHIYAEYDKEAEFLVEIEKRLKLFHAHGKTIEAFFHLPFLSSTGLKQLFHLCENNNVIITGMDEQQEHPMQVKQGDLWSGQEITLDHDTIWIGDLHKESYLITKANLYVIGKVEGSIDACHKSCEIAASLFDAKVRICDSSFHNVTSFAPGKVYYINRQVILNEVKGGAIWER